MRSKEKFCRTFWRRKECKGGSESSENLGKLTTFDSAVSAPAPPPASLSLEAGTITGTVTGNASELTVEEAGGAEVVFLTRLRRLLALPSVLGGGGAMMVRSSLLVVVAKRVLLEECQ